MEQVLYFIIRGITRTTNFLPLRVHYWFSDLYYVFAFYIVKYRRKVVRRNLINSFPERSISEIKEIEKKYYRHIADLAVETLYFADISAKEIEQRITIDNPELPIKYLNEGRQVIISLGHYNNWEWLCFLKYYTNANYYPVYKPLHSKAFDKFYRNLRSRFGAEPIPKNTIFKRLYNDLKQGIPSVSGFVNDQTPKRENIQYWTTFLNQDTPMFLGVEKIAKKLDTVVITAEIQKPKRGHYLVKFTLITDKPKEEAPFAITEKDTRHLEEIIRRNPEYWLWSHKRWKHKKE
ncbi:lysophospholipid acyltransferase family protein [Halosquirtibacter xylanolyticus]|uniref:lysophospholipid acyltransferase family protein n=1 Tax=Halosquirtibacter xylanolyticus TaxID=3374599 RepID=UPI00374A98DB|nr:lysophospholipid acyltransferase family protein [Prolixibacteraceae bacterium]